MVTPLVTGQVSGRAGLIAQAYLVPVPFSSPLDYLATHSTHVSQYYLPHLLL